MLPAFPLRSIYLSDSRTVSVSEKLPASLHELPQGKEAKRGNWICWSQQYKRNTYSLKLGSEKPWLFYPCSMGQQSIRDHFSFGKAGLLQFQINNVTSIVTPVGH